MTANKLTADAAEGQLKIHLQSRKTRLEAVFRNVRQTDLAFRLSRTALIQDGQDVGGTAEIASVVAYDRPVSLDLFGPDASSDGHASIDCALHEDHFITNALQMNNL